MAKPVDDIELEIEKDPFEMVPTDLFVHYPDRENPHAVSHGATVCYAVLRYLGADKNFRISQAKIAARMGRDLRSVQRYIAELKTARWLLVRPVYVDKGRAASHYLVLRSPVTSDDDPRWLRHVERGGA